MKNGHYLDIGLDIRIWYTEEGVGEKTLIFIHGLANYHGVWEQNVKELSKHFRCICLDLPGNGLSSKSENRPYSMVFYAESVYRFIATKGIEKPVLVGHSMGGQVSLMVALRYPELLASLILIAPSGLESFSSTEKIWMKQMIALGSWMGSDTAYLRSAILDSFYQKAEQQAAPILEALNGLMAQHKGLHWGKMVRANIEAMLDEPVLPFIKQVNLPVLVVFGKEDKLIPNTLIHPGLTINGILNQSISTLPNFQKILIESAGHFVQWEKAKEVNQALIKFLEE